MSERVQDNIWASEYKRRSSERAQEGASERKRLLSSSLRDRASQAKPSQAKPSQAKPSGRLSAASVRLHVAIQH